MLNINFILPVLENPKLRWQNCVPIYWQAGTSQIAPTVLLSKRKNFFFLLREQGREKQQSNPTGPLIACWGFFFPSFCKKILEVHVLPRLTPDAAEGRLSRVASLPFHFCHSQRRTTLSKSHLFLAAKPQPLLHSDKENREEGVEERNSRTLLEKHLLRWGRTDGHVAM